LMSSIDNWRDYTSYLPSRKEFHFDPHIDMVFSVTECPVPETSFHDHESEVFTIPY